MQPLETYEHQGVKVSIYWDEYGNDHANPRDNDNLGTMVCWHPDYVLGDEQLKNGDGRGAVETAFETERGRTDVRSMRVLSRYLSLVRGAACIMPLYLYDHSGISISAGSVNPFDNPTVRRDEYGRGMGWDTSMVGFVYTTHERITELCGDGETYHADEWIRTQLLAEVEEYDRYLRGEVYGYVVDEGGPDEESCWGFLGDECVKQEAESVAAAIAAERSSRRELGAVAHMTGAVMVA